MVIETTVVVSALAGLASFLSPCILPILPAFISYLSGTTINEIQNSTTIATTTIGEVRRLNGESRNMSDESQKQEQQHEMKQRNSQLIIPKSTSVILANL